jgi:hypothetical protein
MKSKNVNKVNIYTNDGLLVYEKYSCNENKEELVINLEEETNVTKKRRRSLEESSSDEEEEESNVTKKRRRSLEESSSDEEEEESNVTKKRRRSLEESSSDEDEEEEESNVSKKRTLKDSSDEDEEEEEETIIPKKRILEDSFLERMRKRRKESIACRGKLSLDKELPTTRDMEKQDFGQCDSLHLCDLDSSDLSDKIVTKESLDNELDEYRNLRKNDCWEFEENEESYE